MKNNKGMTIIELITAIVLVSIILVFMLNLLITLQNFSVQNQNETDLLVNQAVIIKAIEKDINEYKLKGVANCNIEDLVYSKKYPVVPEEIYNAALKKVNNTALNNNETMLLSNFYCLKLTFDEEIIEDNIGYLVQYSYNYNNNTVKNVVGYKRASNQTIRESKIKMNSNNNKGKVTSSCSIGVYENCSLKIVLPIYDEIGNSYDIIATYIYKYNGFTYSKGNAYGFEIK